MPIYEYECNECGRITEALQKIADAPLTKCTHCSGELHKLISQSSFHLKGTGWYVTDYANKSAKSDEKSSVKTSKKSDEPKGSTDSAAKPDGKKSTPD